MRFRVLLLLAIFSLPLPLLANTVYTYTGNNFTTVLPGLFGTAYSTSDSVTGWFTVASPLGDFFLGSVTPASFSFSDGAQTIDSSNGSLSGFDINTDASGNIQNWYISASALLGSVSLTTDPFGDAVSDFSLGSANNASGGTWKSSSSSAPTPEPESLILMGTGLLGLAGMLRRRLQLS